MNVINLKNGVFKKPTDNYPIGFIPREAINVLIQVRKTFDPVALQNLADEIAANGLINEPMVAMLDDDHGPAYKKFFEELDGEVNDDMVKFVDESGAEWWLNLICGERRYRAIGILQTTGCSLCKEAALKEGHKLRLMECYEKHFSGNLIKVKLAINIDPVLAKATQFSENHYLPPPFHEEAEAYDKFYKCLRMKYGKLTIKKFGEEMGVSVERIRRFLWYCDLPEKIQRGVRAGIISPTNALEFRRVLNERSLKKVQKNRVVKWLYQQLTLLPNTSNKLFREKVVRGIDSQKNIGLFDNVPGVKPVRKNKVRSIIGKEFLPILNNLEPYYTKVELLVKNGDVGQGKPFSGRAPTRRLKRFLLEHVKVLIPGFEYTVEQLAQIKQLTYERKTRSPQLPVASS